jgi:hypothetical protein
MTKQADLKRRIRARMAKTGESYVTARAQVLAAAPPPADDALHVSNGDATDLAGTGVAQRILYWRDVLHDGPVPALDPDDLRRVRADHIARAHRRDPAEVLATFTERDHVLAANRNGRYVLWFEADLYDQLQIIEILSRLADLAVPASRVTLICIGEYPGIAHFGGLGELTGDQLRDLLPGALLSPAALDLARHAWAAFRAPSPSELRAVAAARSGELRFLGEAFDRLGREYPSVRDGLSLAERRVLAAVAEGAPDAGTAFVRAAAREARPYLGDSSCYAMMSSLIRAPVPLLDGEVPVSRTTGLRLTDAGARVLGGDEDHVRLNGIDRWIGGVHLYGREVPWRWDDGTETIVG